MDAQRFPVGLEIDICYPNFNVTLQLLSASKLKFEIKDGPYARCESVDISVVPLGNHLFALDWREQDGSIVTNVQDYDRGVVYSHAVLSNGEILRMIGSMTITNQSARLSDDRPQRNKKLVLDAMTALFQNHDASSVDRLYAEDYIQHNPSIPQGRDVLRALVSGLTQDVYYEPGIIVAEGNFVAIHGRIRGWADVPQVVVDIFRIENGRIAEHWDVLQNEVILINAIAGLPMFEPKEFLLTKS